MLVALPCSRQSRFCIVVTDKLWPCVYVCMHCVKNRKLLSHCGDAVQLNAQLITSELATYHDDLKQKYHILARALYGFLEEVRQFSQAS